MGHLAAAGAACALPRRQARVGGEKAVSQGFVDIEEERLEPDLRAVCLLP